MPRKPLSNRLIFRKTRKDSARFSGRVLHLRAFGRKHDISPSYIHKILSGERPLENVSVGIALKIAAAVNCSIEELGQRILGGHYIGSNRTKQTVMITETEVAG